MPIYEYQCQVCHHRLEVMQKISDTPLIECPKCGKNSLEKTISTTSFQLKGGGWYATDYKKVDKPQDTAQAKGSPEVKTESKAE
jgi:putative FmdB family regulatory protein